MQFHIRWWISAMPFLCMICSTLKIVPITLVCLHDRKIRCTRFVSSYRFLLVEQILVINIRGWLCENFTKCRKVPKHTHFVLQSLGDDILLTVTMPPTSTTTPTSPSPSTPTISTTPPPPTETSTSGLQINFEFLYCLILHYFINLGGSPSNMTKFAYCPPNNFQN